MSGSSAQDFLEAGVARAQAGDTAGAEALFKQCIAVDPLSSLGNLNLGLILMRRKNAAEAEPFILRSIQTQPTLENVSALAEILHTTGRLEGAAQCHRNILKSWPQHKASLSKLAQISERLGNRTEALQLYRQAWELDPHDLKAAIDYGSAVASSNLAESAAVMDRLLAEHAGNAASQVKIMFSLLLFKEFHEREKRGLMPYHATSIDEMFFKFSAADFSVFQQAALRNAAENPQHLQAAVDRFFAFFCARDHKRAQICLDVFKSALKGNVWDAVTFDPAFYGSVESTAPGLFENLVPIRDIIATAFDADHVIYLSCNYEYFKNFGMPMLRSLADRGPGTQVLIHIMDGSDQDLVGLASFCRGLKNLKIAVTAEQTGVNQQDLHASRAYYHAIRFVRYYQHLLRHGRTLWMMDVDALFNLGPDALYKVIGDKDIAIRVRAGRFEPWNQFSAGIVGGKATPRSLRYFRLIAAYITQFHLRGELRWGIDQAAMYGSYVYLQEADAAPEIAFLNDKAMDLSYVEDGILWCSAGVKKWALLRDAGDAEIDESTGDGRYQVRFNKYR